MGKVEILAVSHGMMAEGMVRAVKMIVGDMGNLDYLCLHEECSILQFKVQLEEKIAQMKEAEQIVIFADIGGGSPYTTAIELLNENGLLGKSYIAAGMNLPLLLEAVLYEGSFDEISFHQLLTESRENIKRFQLVNDDDNEL